MTSSVPEEVAARRQNDLVGEQAGGVALVVVGGDGDVEQLSLLPEVAKGVGHIGAELIPSQAELL